MECREGSWIGWERKRGKIEEFNRLLRGDRETSYAVHVGDSRSCRNVRYCITLDSDTRLARDAARKLVGIISHPSQPSPFDPESAGHAGLRDFAAARQRHLASAAGSLFARVYAGHTGVDPYTRQSPTRTRICSTKVSSPARASTTSRVHGRTRRSRARERPPCRMISSRASTPDRPRHRRGGGRRLPGRRTRPRAAAASLGPRRLANPLWLFPVVPHAAGSSAIASPSSRAGRFSTTCVARSWLPLRCPAGRGLDAPTGSPGLWTLGFWRPRLSGVCPAAPALAGPAPQQPLARVHASVWATTRTAIAQALLHHVPRLPRVRDAACHRAHAGATGVHPATAARVGNGRGPRRPRGLRGGARAF